MLESFNFKIKSDTNRRLQNYSERQNSHLELGFGKPGNSAEFDFGEGFSTRMNRRDAAENLPNHRIASTESAGCSSGCQVRGISHG
jgi:hypothetical protein